MLNAGLMFVMLAGILWFTNIIDIYEKRQDVQ